MDSAVVAGCCGAVRTWMDFSWVVVTFVFVGVSSVVVWVFFVVFFVSLVSMLGPRKKGGREKSGGLSSTLLLS